MIVNNRIIEVGISHDIIIGVYKLWNSHKEFTYQITDKAQIHIYVLEDTWKNKNKRTSLEFHGGSSQTGGIWIGILWHT